MGAEFDRRERVHAMMERAGLVSPRPKTDVCDTPAEGVSDATAPPYKGRGNPFYLPEERLTLLRVLWRPGQSKRRQRNPPKENPAAVEEESIAPSKASHDRHVRWADDGGRGERPAVKAAAKKKRGNTELEDWARAATKRAQRAASERAQFWNSTASVSVYPRHERFARRGTARREPERDRAREPVVLTTIQRNLNSSIGPAWTSEANGYDLLSEHQLLRHGIYVMKVSG